MFEAFSFRNNAKTAAIELVKGIECTLCRVKLSANAAKRCSQCKCVKYCSVKCQRRHWEAHKKLCAEITPTRIAVDAAFDITQIQFKPGFNYEVDMMVKFWIATQYWRPFGGVVRNFSIETFHLNLKRVRAKKWWLCKTTKSSWKQNWIPGNVVRVESTEVQQFYQICYYMAQSDILSFDDYMNYFDSTPGTPLMIPGQFLVMYKLHSEGIACLQRKKIEFRNLVEKFFFDSDSIHDLD